MRTSFRVVFLLALLGACSAQTRVSTDTITRGAPECVDGNQVRVRFDTCLSSSCDKLVSAECTLTADGTTAVIVGEAVVERQEGDCTADCGLVDATCAGELDSAVEVRFGDELRDLADLSACP